MGRGTPAISGGAVFFKSVILLGKRAKCPMNAYFQMVLGSNPMLCTKDWSWMQTPHLSFEKQKFLKAYIMT
jgi:hypothetical protein